MQFTNKLIHETSPYLLQHAHNPVSWYPWGNEALELAKKEDKPILVSIGYSACHWCHVMEKESFENEETAMLMNKYFISIKIDREERPDLDHIYMDAVQAIAGNGGWPLNVFLTPECKPFYGGTYFPPLRAFNRMSWKEVLEAVHEAYTKRKHEIVSQAESLTAHLINSNTFGINKPANGQHENIITKDTLQNIADNILKSADTEWGGFGRAPKFPQTFAILYLIRHYHFTKHQPSLDQAILSLDKMIRGGIYDHLGGGFARYSTDNRWLAPHFEKMLYDNALLINVLSEAYQLTKNSFYTDTLKDTIHFIQRELLSPDNGFYCALDADSEGVEGKYYVWSKDEIDKILGEESGTFCWVYDISEKGNWEHTNILWLPESLNQRSIELNINVSKLKEILLSCRGKLLSEREKRIRPALDDKILLGWNALMITACCKAYTALEDETCLRLAEKNVVFLESKFQEETGEWKHSWKNNTAKYPAFLDDYAFLIQAYIHLQEITGNQEYLVKAKKLTDKILIDFADEEGRFFYFTGAAQDDIFIRKKEIYDGATPSGNAVMAFNLFYLSAVFNNTAWREHSETMLYSLGGMIIKYPTSFGLWALLLQSAAESIYEIAVTGPAFAETVKKIMKEYIPNKIIQSAERGNSVFPLLEEKQGHADETLIYLCSNYSCKQPVHKTEELMMLLNL